MADVCAIYREAPTLLSARGERVMSTDELTGVQALERKHPDLPLAPGKVSSGANLNTSVTVPARSSSAAMLSAAASSRRRVDQPARKPISWATSKEFWPPTLLPHAGTSW